MKLFKIPMVVTSLVGLRFLAGLDAPPARADFTFGSPVNLQSAFPLLNTVNEDIDCFSADGLEMYIESTRSGGYGGWDLWVCKRTSPEDNWGPPENLGPTVNSTSWDFNAFITTDGLGLYFISNRPGGYGDFDLYVTRRATRDSAWGPPTNLGPAVNTSYLDDVPSVSADGLELYFTSNRPGGYGGYDLYVSKRAATSDPWGLAADLGPAVNSPANEEAACISPDGLLLFFSSDRPGGSGDLDIYVTRRASRSAPWQPPVNVGPVINGPSIEIRPILAADGSTLYFWRISSGTYTHWQAPILLIVDFNGDGKVDGKEVLALAQHWGQNYAPGDIAPYAWGDGVVDANDLKVLAGHVGQEVNDPTLVAHWALDETAGTTAADSAGSNNLTVTGGATWQPVGGKIGGALALDGQSGYAASAGSVLNPARGPFSVIAWVKGGAPGQVIVSQGQGANWLRADEATGTLRTDLRQPATSGRNGQPAGPPLTSSAVIADGNWHRVGFVWDGSQRILYVDDVEVARDSAAGLEPSTGGLYLGVAGKLTPGTFWSGLIDDIRIYSRAVQP
ncbi:MAG: LamG domain-containing protein [Actinobacteria bacterium]|nr:LamG domain-containing protein [Actinomycetota bacterium]